MQGGQFFSAGIIRKRRLAPVSRLSCLFLIPDVNAQSAAEVFFLKSVRPLFIARCLDCHSEDNDESELRMDWQTVDFMESGC